MNTIINCKADIEALQPAEKSEFLARLAATIRRYDAAGAVITDLAGIERFGYQLEDFKDTPILPFTAPSPPPISMQ